jgi:hypothetical protein
MTDAALPYILLILEPCRATSVNRRTRGTSTRRSPDRHRIAARRGSTSAEHAIANAITACDDTRRMFPGDGAA